MYMENGIQHLHISITYVRIFRAVSDWWEEMLFTVGQLPLALDLASMPYVHL